MGDFGIEWGPVYLALIPLALALIVVWIEVHRSHSPERDEVDAS